MTEIKYWQISGDNTVKTASKTAKDAKLGDFRAFEATMLDSLMGSSSLSGGSSSIMSGFGSNPSANALFGNLGGNSKNLEERLKNIHDDGMDKVLAAQFSNPLPNFGQFQSKDSTRSDLGGLNDMIALTMQSQMIKARKAIEEQSKHYAIKSDMKVPDVIGNEPHATYQTLAEFITSIQSQIDEASTKYGVETDSIKQLI